MKKKELIKKLKPYWLMAREVEDRYLDAIVDIENLASKATGIEGIEMYRCDGELVGIGDYTREMKLIRGEELEK